jgi:hypothetical protein
MTDIHEVTDVILAYTWFTNVRTVQTVSVTTEFRVAVQHYLESICKILINLLQCRHFIASRVTNADLENLSQYSD